MHGVCRGSWLHCCVLLGGCKSSHKFGFHELVSVLGLAQGCECAASRLNGDTQCVRLDLVDARTMLQKHAGHGGVVSEASAMLSRCS